MRSLLEFLSINVKVKEHINFPKELNYDKIINALIDFGFKKIILANTGYTIANNEMINIALSSEKPLLAIGDDLTDNNGDIYRFFRFCNKGKISKENPIFLVRITYDNTIPKTKGTGFCSIIYPEKSEEIKNYKEFLNIIDNYF